MMEEGEYKDFKDFESVQAAMLETVEWFYRDIEDEGPLILFFNQKVDAVRVRNYLRNNGRVGDRGFFYPTREWAIIFRK
jgi:hypothetical protein